MGPNQTYKHLHSKHKQNKKTIHWKDNPANDGTDKGLISKIYKQLIQRNNNKKQTTQSKMGRRPK